MEGHLYDTLTRFWIKLEAFRLSLDIAFPGKPARFLKCLNMVYLNYYMTFFLHFS
jgi:hypothetical protein